MLSTDEEKKTDKEKQENIRRYTTFIILAIFSVLIIFSFMRYALVDDVKNLTEVHLGWLSIFLALLAWYTKKTQMLKKRRIKLNGLIPLPGEYFVFIILAIGLFLPFLRFNGWWIQRVPTNLYWFVVGVIVIYAGGKIYSDKIEDE